LTVNLHSYWDTVVVQALGSDPQAVATHLIATVTPEEKAAWETGDARTWAQESYGVAKTSVYTIGSKPGCDGGQSPVPMPTGYDQSASTVAAIQLEKAGVRLALILNRALPQAAPR